MTDVEFLEAIALFKLSERATLKELKVRHRELARKHHPDGGGDDSDAIREINAAYTLLLSYCKEYRFSFTQEEFLEQHPEERLRQQFDWNSVWNGDNGEED